MWSLRELPLWPWASIWGSAVTAELSTNWPPDMQLTMPIPMEVVYGHILLWTNRLSGDVPHLAYLYLWSMAVQRRPLERNLKKKGMIALIDAGCQR